MASLLQPANPLDLLFIGKGSNLSCQFVHDQVHTLLQVLVSLRRHRLNVSSVTHLDVSSAEVDALVDVIIEHLPRCDGHIRINRGDGSSSYANVTHTNNINTVDTRFHAVLSTLPPFRVLQ